MQSEGKNLSTRSLSVTLLVDTVAAIITSPFHAHAYASRGSTTVLR